MKTLEQLLKTKVFSQSFGNLVKISPDFRVAVQEIDEEKGVRIIIHALNYNSDTLDFWVKDNILKII